MRLTLKAAAKKALMDYSAARRPAWALMQPAQLALLASNTHWCQVRCMEGSLIAAIHLVAAALLCCAF